MIKFTVVRVAGAALTLLIAIAVAFLLTRIAGDPVHNILGDLATQEQVDEMRRNLGLDAPLVRQFADFMGGLLRGDLGTSLRYSRPNTELIVSRLGASMVLAGTAVAFGVITGYTLGVIAAFRENTWVDRTVMSVALLGQSVPAFWLGMMLISVFAVGLQWLPAGQQGGLSHLVLPAFTLATLPMAKVARLARSQVSEVLHEPFVTAARVRGFGRTRVLFRHILPNSLQPVITLVGIQVGTLLSGAVTVEYVFNWQGLGTLATQAVQFRDFRLVQALVVFGAAAFVVINLVIDLINGWIDPRVREAN